MSTHKNFISIFLAVLFIALVFVLVPQTVYAKTQACYDSSGLPKPCPDTSKSKPGPKNRPTPVTINPISTTAPTPLPTSTSTVALIITGGGAGPNNPNSLVPAVQNPGQGSSPFNLPGILGSIIAVLVLGGLFFGLLVPAIRKRSPDDGSDKMGAQPHMDDGAESFFKFEDAGSQFQKADGSSFEHDISVKPGTTAESLNFGEPGSDKMGAQPHMDTGPVTPGSNEESLNFLK